MAFRSTLALLAALAATACRMDQPELPGRGVLHGSDWIPGRSKSSFTTGGEAVVIENVGRHELLIGSGADAVFLQPGGVHQTDGGETHVYNPAGGQARILFHAPDLEGASTGLEIQAKHRTEARTIRSMHDGGATPAPAAAGRAIEDPR